MLFVLFQRGCQQLTELRLGLGRRTSQLQSKSPTTKPGLAAVVKRGANENSLAQSINLIVRSSGKQRPVNSDDGCAKAAGNLRRSTFPGGSGARKMELIAIEKRDRDCCTSGRKSDIPKSFTASSSGIMPH